MRQIASIDGKVVDTDLEDWQITFCYYMATHAGIGQSKTMSDLMQLSKDDSLFSGAVGRTFKFAYDMGYNKCLHELCD